MLEVLQFVFSSFWIWLGSCVMLAIVCTCATQVRLFTINTKTNNQHVGK